MNHERSSGPALIAVMGATGSGKTSFINLASGFNFRVGHGLRSCTSEIQATTTFRCDEQEVVLVDSPGFNDTELTDTEVLEMIAVYLSEIYERGKKLTGVIYLHAIDEARVGGISRKNFRLFRELCGEPSLVNVAIVTTKWDTVRASKARARETQLATEDIFFKPALEKGARLLRHDNGFESAHAVLRSLLPNSPGPLMIQSEIVDLHRPLGETSAGHELNRALLEQVAAHKEEFQKLGERLNDAKDKETQEEIQKELEITREKMEKLMKESRRLKEELSKSTWRRWAVSGTVMAMSLGLGIYSIHTGGQLRAEAFEVMRLAEAEIATAWLLDAAWSLGGLVMKAIF